MAALGTFDAQIEHFNPNNPYAGDDTNPIRFYMGTMPDPVRTEIEGHPCHMDVEFIQIYNSKDNIVDRPVRLQDKQRWPKQYMAWKATGESDPATSGMRLENWTQITRAQAEELRYFKVFTVEQLAAVPDSQQMPMGFMKLKGLAVAYVEMTKGEKPLLKMQMEIEARDGQLSEMQAEIKRLTKLVEKHVDKTQV